MNDTDVAVSNGTPKELLIFKAFGISLAVLANIIGNSFCLVVIRLNTQMEQVTRILMTSATVADLSTAIFVSTPILGATIADRWPFGELFCTVSSTMGTLFVMCCIGSLLLLNAERYIAITRPFHYSSLMTPGRARVAVVVIWTSSVILSTISSTCMPQRTSKYSPSLHSCIVSAVRQNEHDISGNVVIVTFILAPIAIILFMYIRIFAIARGHAKRIADIAVIVAAPKPADGSRRKQTIRPQKKAFTTFFLMVLALVLFSFPLMVVFIYENATSRELPRVYIYVAEISAMTIGLWNLVIYYARNAAFRQTAKRVIVYVFPCIHFSKDDVLDFTSSRTNVKS